MAFLNNDINNTFWFFYIVISLYIVTPIFSILVDENNGGVLLCIVIGYFIFNDVLCYLQGLFHLTLNAKYITQPLISSSYLGYFIMGYLIRIDYFSKRVENVLMIAGFTAFILSVLNTLTNGKYVYLNNIGPFLYSIALYMLIKRETTKITNQRVLNIFARLSGATLGIYILHPLFYALFDKVVYDAAVRNWRAYLPVLNNPVHIYLLPILTYILLSILVLALKKIKIIRYILP